MRYERKPSRGPKLIRIDIDPAEMRRFEPDVADRRRLRDGLPAARASAFARASRRTATRVAEIAAAKRIGRSRVRAHPSRRLRSCAPSAPSCLATASSSPSCRRSGFTTYTGAFPILAPRTYISEGFQGTLGFGFPTALGAKVANPDKAVVSVTGDGGFMFGVQELATAAQYGIALVTIVFNNHSFAQRAARSRNAVRRPHDRFSAREPGLRSIGRELRRRGARVSSSRASLQRALEQELAQRRPALIEVALDARRRNVAVALHPHAHDARARSCVREPATC